MESGIPVSVGNCYGFKSSSVAFSDMFAGSKTGLSVKVADVMQDFNDGITVNSGRDLDTAISQNLFFGLVDSAGQVLYSRNGQFKLDESVTSSVFDSQDNVHNMNL